MPIYLASTTFKWSRPMFGRQLSRPCGLVPLGSPDSGWECRPQTCWDSSKSSLARAAEWGQPLLAASLDAKGAFGAMLPDKAGEQLHASGATAAQTSAFLREIVGVRAQPAVAGLSGPLVLVTTWLPAHWKARKARKAADEAMSRAIAMVAPTLGRQSVRVVDLVARPSVANSLEVFPPPMRPRRP